MKYVQLHFLGMSNLIQIEDNQTHYTIDLPMQKPIIGMNYTYGINRKKGTDISSKIRGKARLVFVIFPNEHYETNKDNAPEYIAEFSHMEILE